MIMLGITHKGVDVNISEGNLARKFEAHHDHAGNPEEENVQPRDQGGSRVKRFEILSLLGPPQG